MRIIPVGEANIDVVLFTKEFGKITARVQSARKQESKMRMFLTRFRLVTVDLVRGKSVWRLTGITGEPSGSFIQHEGLLNPIYRMFRLSEFLVQGEEAHPELFQFFKKVLGFNTEYGAQSSGLEIFCVVKVLDYLGYWNGAVFPATPTQELLEACTSNKKELVKKINESISATQIMVY